MVCKKCGRELRDDAKFCRGCGTQQIKETPPEREKISGLLSRPVSTKEKSMKAGSALLMMMLFVGLSIGAYFLYPTIAEKLGRDVYEGIVQEIDAAKEIDAASGEILVLTTNIDDIKVKSEKAYDDGTWDKEFLVNGSIVVKTLRRDYSEAWINTHIFSIYPDVESVSAVDAAPSDSDEASMRIRFRSDKAKDCSIEAVCIESGGYDHLFIVEMPDDEFEELQPWLDEWVESLELVDASAVPQPA